MENHNEDNLNTEEAVHLKAVKTVDATSSGGGSKALPKMLLLVGVMFAVGLGLVFWKTKVAGHHGSGEIASEVTKEEMELLVKDFNPMQLKQMAENPEQKTKLVENLKELLAIASQAQKDGFNNKPEIKEELESIEKQLYAQGYDKKLNADKGPMPPFGFIDEARVKEFWGDGTNQGGLSWIWNGAKTRRREAEFRAFINPKIELARKNGQLQAGQEPNEEQLNQVRDQFAKVQIYYDEVQDKLANVGSLPAEEQEEWKEWEEKTELQIRLQKAQVLTQNYAKEFLSKKFEVTKADVEQYIADNPELLDSEGKLKKAEEVLKKVNDGGDFAELAKEFSEDPGSKNKGGLYEGIGKGQFAPEFEAATMALEPGEIADKPIKTNFGYHIIKLEKRGETKGSDGKTQPTYDVRHILISTMVKDPDKPNAREMPAEQYAKTKLEKEKQEKVMEDIKKNNPVNVAEDFEIPEVSEEELKKMQDAQMKQMQQMQQQQGGPKGAPPKPPAPKK